MDNLSIPIGAYNGRIRSLYTDVYIRVVQVFHVEYDGNMEQDRFKTLHVRLTSLEYDVLKQTAERIGIDVSTLVRTAILGFQNRVNSADHLLQEADTRALTELELAVLRVVEPDVWSRLPRDELRKTPAARREPITTDAILELARLQGYIVMPSDPADAALVGATIVRLERAGRVERASSRPDNLASPQMLRRGMPNAAVGVVPCSGRRAAGAPARKSAASRRAHGS